MEVANSVNLRMRSFLQFTHDWQSTSVHLPSSHLGYADLAETFTPKRVQWIPVRQLEPPVVAHRPIMSYHLEAQREFLLASVSGLAICLYSRINAEIRCRNGLERTSFKVGQQF